MVQVQLAAIILWHTFALRTWRQRLLRTRAFFPPHILLSHSAESEARGSSNMAGTPARHTQKQWFCTLGMLLQALKEKTRIFVPEGVLLLGVIDEMNVLRSGEVFLQINPSVTSGKRPVLITGPVIMARNPCFHPGDIRKLQVRTASVRL